VVNIAAKGPVRTDRRPDQQGEMPMKRPILILAASLLLGSTAAHSQALNDPVLPHPNPESLFTSKDPKLNRNKQAALGIMRDLLEAGHWSDAGKFLTQKYIQHNPLAKSGLDGVVYYFVTVAKVQPKPIPEKMKTKIVAVQAEGDYVTVSTVRELKDPKDPTKTYTTTWFDMWRFVDGKADEHWDPATLPPTAPPAAK
jgi:predicted SnoaL-like aldol condensation-catalyzing enzyme